VLVLLGIAYDAAALGVIHAGAANPFGALAS
jgi:hypothetical protein